MNARLSKLLIACLASLMFSGPALASPRFMDRDFLGFSTVNDRAEREYGKREDRELRKEDFRKGKKDMRKADDRDQERGFGYGYERRYERERQDDRGRR